MANKQLFGRQLMAQGLPPADTQNDAGGKAYALTSQQALAQMACTNCFNGSYYASAETLFDRAREAVMGLVGEPEFLAKTAVYCRTRGYMKDMPAFLSVVLAAHNPPLFRKVFRKVIDNGKMLRNFVQMARSGVVTGRVFNLSAGTCRHAIQEWFDSRDARALLQASIGNDPTLRDILRMARPKPGSPEREALFGYLIGKSVDQDRLPDFIRQYEQYKRTLEGPVPEVDFRLLDGLRLPGSAWREIARRASWQMTRMNLNTFARHGVFTDTELAGQIANRLSSREEIVQARQFPYQLYAAWMATTGSGAIPEVVRTALHDAMEIAIENVPRLEGRIYVCVDTSGSMSSPVTGQRGPGQSSSVSCVAVAGLIASAIARGNPQAEIWTFSDTASPVDLSRSTTVLENTRRLAQSGGGTNISAPLRELNQRGARGEAVIYVSDSESWIDSGPGHLAYGQATGLACEWRVFRERNPQAKLVCIDLTPRVNSQLPQQDDVLRVGGFSDAVFEVVASFLARGHDTNHWVDEIEKISLD